MYRSISRMLAVAAVAALVPVVSQAQVLSCYKLGANTTNANCSVVSELTLVSVAALDITEPGNPDFDLSALTAADWIDIINGVATRVQPGGPFNVDVAANAAALNVNISGAVTGSAGRDAADYEYEFIPFANSCSGTGTQIPASATTATGLPNTAGFAQRKLCLYAVLDGTDAASIAPGTYTLTVTLAITAP